MAKYTKIWDRNPHEVGKMPYISPIIAKKKKKSRELTSTFFHEELSLTIFTQRSKKKTKEHIGDMVFVTYGQMARFSITIAQ